MEKAVRKAAVKVSQAKKCFYRNRRAFSGMEEEFGPRVMTLSEYAQTVGSDIREATPGTDIREFWLSEAARLRGMDRNMVPTVLVFMAGISYPPVTVDPASELGTAASRLGIPVRTYYPFISDASFVSLLGDVPLVNLGTYGKDAHMFRHNSPEQQQYFRCIHSIWRTDK